MLPSSPPWCHHDHLPHHYDDMFSEICKFWEITEGLYLWSGEERNELYRRSVQEVHWWLHEINQRKTWRTENRNNKAFYDRDCRMNQAHRCQFQNHQICIWENMSPYGSVALLDLREDGVILSMIFLKDSSETGKCSQVWQFGPTTYHCNWCCFSSTHQGRTNGTGVILSSSFIFTLLEQRHCSFLESKTTTTKTHHVSCQK